jgi:hypothetical protein
MTAVTSDKRVHEHNVQRLSRHRTTRRGSSTGIISEDPTASIFGAKVTNYTVPHPRRHSNRCGDNPKSRDIKVCLGP